MNVLFFSLGRFKSINQYSLYTDLLRQFAKEGHNVYVLCSRERRTGKQTELVGEGNTKILKIRIGNITKTNIIEKGISTLLIEKQYIKAIKKYFSDVSFDLVLYATPPITFEKAVRYVKKKHSAKSYLLLKDIFPQNAVDIGLLKKRGIKGIIYKFFRNKEKKLYNLSDKIGCMSEANRQYITQHNPYLNSKKVEVCPNCIDIRDMTVTLDKKTELRQKYGIPEDKKVFVYGGNLGKPQGIPFIIKCLEKCSDVSDAFFLIIGSGTEFSKLKEYAEKSKGKNLLLLEKLPKEEYDAMIASCDVGLVFLDYRFTIPNFPSRILSYMQAGLPVLASTDQNTDVGAVIEEGGFGWKCPSNSESEFKKYVNHICSCDLTEKSKAARKYLSDNYSVLRAYNTINDFCKSEAEE